MEKKTSGKKKRVPEREGRDSFQKVTSEANRPAAKPVSLAPLEFEEAMRDLIKIGERKSREKPVR